MEFHPMQVRSLPSPVHEALVALGVGTARLTGRVAGDVGLLLRLFIGLDGQHSERRPELLETKPDQGEPILSS